MGGDARFSLKGGRQARVGAADCNFACAGFGAPGFTGLEHRGPLPSPPDAPGVPTRAMAAPGPSAQLCEQQFRGCAVCALGFSLRRSFNGLCCHVFGKWFLPIAPRLFRGGARASFVWGG